MTGAGRERALILGGPGTGKTQLFRALGRSVALGHGCITRPRGEDRSTCLAQPRTRARQLCARSRLSVEAERFQRERVHAGSLPAGPLSASRPCSMRPVVGIGN